MKNLLPAFLLCLLAAGSIQGQTIYSPDFDSKDRSSNTLNKIEITTSYLIFYFTHTTSASYTNGGWVNIRPETYLKGTSGTRRYKLINAEGIPYAPVTKFASAVAFIIVEFQ